jgi:uncharacterized damage-inducible protein DinB
MFENKLLLDDLSRQLAHITDRAKQLLSLSEQELNTRPAEDQWSTAQVIAHLAHYNTIYLPRIASALAEGHKSSTAYKPGWLGNYFTKLMQPLPDGRLPSKMKAPGASVPPAQLDAHQQMKTFIAQQEQFIGLLQQAGSADLGKIRIATSISSLLKLKLGDTFRFLVAHQQRHFVQIGNTLQQAGIAVPL